MDENRTMTFAHSWSNENEPQAYQVDSSGEVIWQWNAKKNSSNQINLRILVIGKSQITLHSNQRGFQSGMIKLLSRFQLGVTIAIVDKKSKKVVWYITDTEDPTP